jgi:hypothetical protein
MTKAQKVHYNKVARLGCSLCRFVLKIEDTPTEIHHIRRAGRRIDAPVIGLCPIHHRGSQTGIHGLGRLAFEELYSITEEELLEKTLSIL